MIATALTCRDVFDYEAQPKAHVPCPLCGAGVTSEPAVDRYGYAIGVSWCPCGMVYLNPRMSDADYATFARDTYRPLLAAYYGQELNSKLDLFADPFARGRAFAIWTALDYWVKTPIRSLLDVGGGTGTAAGLLGKKLQCESIAVLDPNVGELEQAAAAGYATIAGTLADLGEASRFDLVTCLLTADHWCDPLGDLRRLRAVCAGHLWIDIIDAAARRTAESPWKIDHPLYWSDASFKRALKATGWAITCICRPMERNGHSVQHRVSYLCTPKE